MGTSGDFSFFSTNQNYHSALTMKKCITIELKSGLLVDWNNKYFFFFDWRIVSLQRSQIFLIRDFLRSKNYYDLYFSILFQRLFIFPCSWKMAFWLEMCASLATSIWSHGVWSMDYIAVIYSNSTNFKIWITQQKSQNWFIVNVNS